ncbi:hypothetical protein GCM10029976_042470 [Kribbella albertanoniae]|uniref:Uncharacterized protein n=1 Tax=Kribbella albertanoniae TaxID=1266829 RepID=A0A4R4QFV5_9ACTN|nr:hypothetical protein [Kribbella albertanoniae]TDC34032.1 hypothetical protein E1261_04820 [Kribbella albertanoniae]
MPKQSDKAAVLTTRHALICLIAMLVGAAAGGLLYLATESVPLAVLTGGASFVKAWQFLDSVIG